MFYDTGDIREKKRAMVFGSFLGDSLALGVHWIYDTGEIIETYGRVESLIDPDPELYHPTRRKGEFTHYGDQTMILLESIAHRGDFVPEDFSLRWRELFDNYDGYIDQATRTTLRKYSQGKDWKEAGSSSTDLAGASRLAPLIYRYSDDLQTLIEASDIQTKMTHNHPLPLYAAEFFAKCTWEILHGSKPSTALRHTIDESFTDSPLHEMFERALLTIGLNTTTAIEELGQGCEVEQAFPSVIHLILKYEENFFDALVECVMAGGDSAARAMLVGMVLGAYLGMDQIPRKWLSDLKARDKIEKYLDKLDDIT